MIKKAQANGIQLAYEDMGEGPAIVLIMGFGAQFIFWPDDFCQELVQHGYRVIRFDNRDCGESSQIRGERIKHVKLKTLSALLLGTQVEAPYLLSDMAQDTVGLLDALGIEAAHFVGVSMGGMIAQTIAIEHPTRALSLASLSSTTGERIMGELRALRALLSPAPKTRAQAIDRAEYIFRTIGSPGFAFDVKSLRETVGQSYDRGSHPAGVIRQWVAILASGNRRRLLGTVRCPTLVLHGLDDPLIPPAAGIATANAIPGSRLKLIQGLGHDLPRQAWPIIIEAIIENAQRGDAHA